MGPLRLKNRVVMGPMETNFDTTDGSRHGAGRPFAWKNPATGDEVRALTKHDIAEIQEQ
jgi:2,4-dienoyl-CoA reductase-like NADH-dependent reductase (Old Yellow Enzyme family)